MMEHLLGIGELAAATGLAPGTIRMWEQRHGFPQPRRTDAGYRRYTADDVATLRRALAYRQRGLSVPAAIERSREAVTPTARPSIFGALAAGGRLATQRLRKPTLRAVAHAIEDEALASAAGPVVFAAFQEERFYRAVEHRYRRLASVADATVVFAEFAAPRIVAGRPAEIPIAQDDPLANEWTVIVDAPGCAACLLAWELPERRRADGERRFEAVLTTDPQTTRRAATIAARLAGCHDEQLGAQLTATLADRPLAIERPAPRLTSLTTRLLGYLDEMR